MSSLARMLHVLDLFEGERTAWTAEALAEALGATRSTTYRYVKTLTEAGLLTSLPGVGFTLGPRVAELDFRMRAHDPLIVAARPLMAALAAETAGVALLCRRYRDRVLCVHQERGEGAPVSRYERGLARPLTRGAASRVILAHLPAAALRRLYADHAAEFAQAGLGATLESVRGALRAIRQTGWDITAGEVNEGVVGVAAAISDRRGEALGSISVTIAHGHGGYERGVALAPRVTFCAGVLERVVSDS